MRSTPDRGGALMDVVAARLGPVAFRRPSLARWAAEVALVIAGVALLALSARVVIPLPFTPVPVTGQTFAVLLVAAAYGVRRGVVTMILYVLAGVAGLPVLAAGAGVASYGYLAGFVLAAVVTGWLADRGWGRDFPRSLAAMLAGEVAIYAGGLVWLARFVGWGNVVAAGLAPFMAGDALKLVAAALLLPAAWLGVRAALGQEGAR